MNEQAKTLRPLLWVLIAAAGTFAPGWAAAVQTQGVLMGWRGGRLQRKTLLSALCALRTVAMLLFVFAPKTAAVMPVCAAVMRLSFLSAVPPTAGLVARFFGPTHMATLFGTVMVSHQAGGFLGAWLGGKAFEATGNCDWVWATATVLAVTVAVALALEHLPILERRPAAVASVAA